MSQQAGRGVLITRPADEAAATAARVEAAGYAPVIAPLLATRHFAEAAVDHVQAVLVTSGNALPGLVVRPVPLLAVGDVTAAKARAHGFSDVRSAGRDATALAALAVEQLSPADGPLLVACGRGQGAPLCALLRESGFRVKRRVTYAAAPVQAFPAVAAQALQAGHLRAALFLSAQTAVTFARLLPPHLAPELANVLALAIGNGAADALNHLPWRQVRLARTPTLDDVLALI